MKKPTHLLLLFFIMLNCGELVPNPDKNPENMTQENPDPKSNSEKVNEFAIVIHGGAGTILKKNMSEEKEAEYKAKLEEAIRVGYSILDKGGSSLDAVEKTINVLENSPLFNAGKGAVFTNAETNELDASIMDGKTLNRSEEHTSELQSRLHLVCRLLLEKKNQYRRHILHTIKTYEAILVNPNTWRQ